MTAASRDFSVGLMLDPGEYPENNLFGQTNRSRPPDRWNDLREMAEAAEAVGFDVLTLPDHLLYRDGPELTEGTWECYSILAAVAAVTERIDLTILTCVPFRNPALLAKMADTIDEISGGRFILGLGAGWHEPEFQAFGYPFNHRYSRFHEALQIIHGLLRQGAIDFEGDYYTLRECELRPRGPRGESIPIMIGAQGPKMQQLTAQYADLWHAMGQQREPGDDRLAIFQGFQETMDEICIHVGRDPVTLGRAGSLTVNPLNRPEYAETGLGKTIGGSPEQIAREILRWREQGCSHLFLRYSPISVEGIEAMAPVLESLRAA